MCPQSVSSLPTNLVYADPLFYFFNDTLIFLFINLFSNPLQFFWFCMGPPVNPLAKLTLGHRDTEERTATESWSLPGSLQCRVPPRAILTGEQDWSGQTER